MAKFTKQDLEEKFGKPCIEIIPDAALPNPQNPGTMPEETADQIATCIQNATAEVQQYTPFVPDSSIHGRVGITVRNQQFILDAIEYAQRFPDTVPPHLDIEEWLTDMKRYNIFIILFRLADILWVALRRAWRIFAVASFRKLREYYEYVQVLARGGDINAQAIFERLHQYFTHLPRRRMEETSEDLEMELVELQKLVDDSNMKIENLLKKQQTIKKEMIKGIEEEDKIVDKI